jgi:DNA-binding response OmpR family regulator
VSMDIEAHLTAAGCTVTGLASNVNEAKRLIHHADYDAALVDANLEGHPVDEIATLLRNKNCPFAFVSGYGREALPHGFRDAMLLSKPFSKDHLLATAESLLRRRSDPVQSLPEGSRMQAEPA